MHKLSDKQLIKKFSLNNKKVIDIGGSAVQHKNIRIHTLVDLLHPKDVPYITEKRLFADNFVQLDVTREKLPFKDNEFDFCLCTHTLEDLYNPFLLIEEMSRVAKEGYLATPSMGKDMEFKKIDLTDWLTGPRRTPGESHHHWFFVKGKDEFTVIPKVFPILYTREFFIKEWSGRDEFRYHWKGEIKYKRVKTTSIHELINIYRNYVVKNRNKIKFGLVLIYIDSPLRYLKEVVKMILRRGEGYNQA